MSQVASARASAVARDPPRPTEDDKCRLKDLPAEIRNYIFSLAVDEPRTIRLSRTPHQKGKSTEATIKIVYPSLATGLNLLSTCRQFREEVTPVFYALNTFNLHYLRETHLAGAGAQPFDLAKTTKVTLSFLHFDRTKLHVERLANNTLEVNMLGFKKVHCTCPIARLAHSYRGKKSMAKFVDGFMRMNGWAILAHEFRNTQSWGPDCDVCVKAIPNQTW